MKKRSMVGVFIIESLSLEDEKQDRFEGKILERILKLINIPVEYRYIRTEQELSYMIKEFEESNFKYLHLSCQGCKDGIKMTIEDYLLTFDAFSKMLTNDGSSRRLFLSSCSVASSEIFNTVFVNTYFITILGPKKDIKFSDAAIFW